MGVRRIVADLGHVESEFIRANDAYPDELGLLPAWDGLDSVEFAARLQELLQVRIPDEAIERMLPWAGRFTVRDAVIAVLRFASAAAACGECRYCLKGNVSGTCPECGWTLPPWFGKIRCDT